MTSASGTSTLLSERVLRVGPSPTLAVTAKAKQLRADGNDVISLAAGEPDFATPESVCKAIIDAINNGFTRYTPTSGTPELKQAVCDKFKRDNGLNLSASNIVISCGAKHSLYNLIQATVNDGDEVLIPKPYWVSYPEMVRLAGGVPVFVETESTGLVPTAAAISEKITSRTKLLLLNSPSNPTGAVIPDSELRKIADLIISKNIYCISDEIYEYYVYDGLKHSSIVNHIDNWMDHVAIVNGLSKSHSMTGLRVGYIAAAEDIVKRIGMIQDHSTSNPVSIVQVGAVEALKMGKEYARELVVRFEKKRDLLKKSLEEIPALNLINPQGAFYAFVDVSGTGMTADQFATQLLQEKFVATIPGEGFGAPSFIRLSFATSEENITKGIGRIRDWLNSKN